MGSRVNTGFFVLALVQACSSTANPGSTSNPIGNPSGPAAVSGSAGTSAVVAPSAPTGPSAQTAAGTPATVTAPSTGGSAAPSTAPTDPTTVVTPTQPTQPSQPAAGSGAVAGTNECDLHTKWAGDEYCIKPPPADKGFQIHVGPSNYDNPEAQFIMQAGTETVENLPATSGNKTDVFYYYRQYRMRPGTHHLILSSSGLGGKRIGGSQNLSRDNPENGVISPENKGVGIKLAASTPLNVNLHYMNFTSKPILKEAWINIWYRDPSEVTEAASEMYSFAPINVPAGAHVLLHGSCPITGTGRILTHYGHRHANNIRFSTWRTRGGQKELIYEDYDWEDPLTLEYSSSVKNTPANPAAKMPGGWSGMLDLQPGDTIEFECANEAENDEMCILIGDTVGTTVPGLCTYTTTPQ
jgi:hypothetical protein